MCSSSDAGSPPLLSIWSSRAVEQTQSARSWAVCVASSCCMRPAGKAFTPRGCMSESTPLHDNKQDLVDTKGRYSAPSHAWTTRPDRCSWGALCSEHRQRPTQPARHGDARRTRRSSHRTGSEATQKTSRWPRRVAGASNRGCSVDHCTRGVISAPCSAKTRRIASSGTIIRGRVRSYAQASPRNNVYNSIQWTRKFVEFRSPAAALRTGISLGSVLLPGLCFVPPNFL